MGKRLSSTSEPATTPLSLRVEKFTFPKTSDLRPCYELYLEKVKKELGENADSSRIDTEIALRMRLDGHDINVSINTIYRESEWAKLRTSREDRREYVSRIARVSFGTVGDVAIPQRKAEEMRKREVSRQTDNEFFPYSTEDNQLLTPTTNKESQNFRYPFEHGNSGTFS